MPVCEGCCIEMVKVTGALRCPGCRSHFGSFTASNTMTATSVLRYQHKSDRKRSRAAADNSAESEWGVDAIIGVQKFGNGEVYYKVAYELEVPFGSTRWVNMESQTRWESRSHLLDQGCGLLLSEFHDRFNIPMPVPDSYFWCFSAPSTRRDPLTKKLVFRCAIAGCLKEFASKDAAHKHAYSLVHQAKNDVIHLPFGVKSPFVCLACSKVCGFSQMSALTSHRATVHTVKDFDDAEWQDYVVEPAELE